MNSLKATYILLFVLVIIFAGCGGVRSTLRKADKNFEKGDYFIAGNLYKKAYGRIPYKDKSLRGETALKQGDCYMRINNQRAALSYQNAIRNHYPDSIVYLKLAQALHKNGKYRDAAVNYQLYLSSNPDDIVAQNGLNGVMLADSMKNDPTRYRIKKVKEFNVARSSSFSPAFVSSEADVLLITSNRKANKKEKNQKKNPVIGQPNNSLFEIKKNSQGKWEKAEIIDGGVTTKNDEGIPSFTTDGQSMYFTRSITEDNKGEGTVIVVSSRNEGMWGDPQKITIFNDSSISVAHPAIAPDGVTLYFVSDAPNGFGGTDIWRTRLEGGKAMFIENLGPEINTAGNEMFPTFKVDGTLYFSSDGKPGLGGLDIFRAEPIDSLHWIVTNMGVPINSNADDFGMTFAGNTESGFFSSNRGDIRGYDAIWSFILPELTYTLEGKILGRNGSAIPNARINIVGDNGESARINSKTDGSYRYVIQQRDVKYLLQASAPEHLNEYDSISTHNASRKESETFIKNFSLIPTFQSVRINNIYYDFDKSTLRPESKEGLDEIIKMMTENPHITIEMSANTDYKGNDIYNRDLSTRRAQSVIDYLINAGIDAERLSAIGYGEAKPFVVDERTAGEYDFLNIGTELTEEFILTLLPEQQEIANQINRRTEFIILSTTYNMY